MIEVILNEAQQVEVARLWNYRNTDEFSWNCEVCGAQTVGDGSLLGQVDGPAGKNPGTLLVMKLCLECAKSIGDVLLSRGKANG